MESLRHDAGGERPGWQWDQRPGRSGAEREAAARGSGAVQQLIAIGAQRDCEGWRVLVLQGGVAVAWLDAAAARDLAGDLAAMADVIEGKRW